MKKNNVEWMKEKNTQMFNYYTEKINEYNDRFNEVALSKKLGADEKECNALLRHYNTMINKYNEQRTLISFTTCCI